LPIAWIPSAPDWRSVAWATQAAQLTMVSTKAIAAIVSGQAGAAAMYLMTPEDFEPWVGRAVRVAAIPAPVEVTLARLERKPLFAGAEREPFSLFFESPEEVYLLDAAYEFDCGRGGPYMILISQLRPKPGRRIYQAVFN
jgi:hypothetical protein